MKNTCIAVALAAVAAPNVLAFAPPSTGLCREAAQIKNMMGQQSPLFMADDDYTVSFIILCEYIILKIIKWKRNS